MGNCGTKPKTSDGDDVAPPPAEPQTPAVAAEGERNVEEVAAPEEASQAVVVPRSEEAATTTAEAEETDESKENEGVAKNNVAPGETPPTEEAHELPTSSPASII